MSHAKIMARTEEDKTNMTNLKRRGKFIVLLIFCLVAFHVIRLWVLDHKTRDLCISIPKWWLALWILLWYFYDACEWLNWCTHSSHCPSSNWIRFVSYQEIRALWAQAPITQLFIICKEPLLFGENVIESCVVCYDEYQYDIHYSFSNQLMLDWRLICVCCTIFMAIKKSSILVFSIYWESALFIPPHLRRFPWCFSPCR